MRAFGKQSGIGLAGQHRFSARDQLGWTLRHNRYSTLDGQALGASETVTFTLGPDELRYWNAAERDWVQDAATFDVWVGGDATADLGTTFEVTAG